MAKGVPIHKLTLPDAPLRDSAAVLLVRMEEMYEWAPAMRDPANIAELHNLRIAAKRLRYTMELFAPCFPPAFGKVQKTIEEIQERIGAIHDCDVLMPLLTRTLEQESDRERKRAIRQGEGPPPFLAAEGLAALIGRKRDERNRLYAEFLAFWDALPPDALFEKMTRLVQAEPVPDTP